MSQTIKIAGAGLGGLAASILLADRFAVNVYEKNESVGKTGGDDIEAVRNYGLSYDQFAFFAQNGIELNFFNPISKIVKYAPSGRSVVIKSDNGPLFYSFKRGFNSRSLEYQMYKQALGKGVNFYFNTRKTFSDVDIIAVGSVYRNIWAYGAMYKDVSIDKETIFFFMDNKYCPQGYVYLIPYGDGEAAIAATTYNLSCPLPRLFKSFLLENAVVRDALKGATFLHNTAGFAYSNIPESAEINGKKFVGGSAGFVESARGFGVKYAIESGIYAANAIIEGKDYDSLWKLAFEKELIEGFNRRLLIEKFTNDDYEKFLQSGEISISRYNKIPLPFRDSFEKIKNSMALYEWRKSYNLERIIGKQQ